MHVGALSIIVFLALLSLSACSYEEMSGKLIPKEESELAESILSELRTGNIEFVYSLLSDELRGEANEEAIQDIAKYFHSGEPVSVEIIGSQVHTFNEAWNGNFTFEYQFDNGWNLANVALRKVGDTYVIVGLNVYQTDSSQRDVNNFVLAGKSGIHYLVLVLATTVPIFILVSVVYFFKTPITQRKWLWFFFILIGIGSIKINWTTGDYAIEILHLQLLGAGATAMGPHAPWIISAGLPVGAIIFWVRRLRFAAREEPDGEDA